jgi:hypothetical protein
MRAMQGAVDIPTPVLSGKKGEMIKVAQWTALAFSQLLNT